MNQQDEHVQRVSEIAESAASDGNTQSNIDATADIGRERSRYHRTESCILKAFETFQHKFDVFLLTLTFNHTQSTMQLLHTHL